MIIKEIHDGKNKNSRGEVVPLLIIYKSILNSLPFNPFDDIFSEVIDCSGFAIHVKMWHSSGSLRTRIGCF